MRLLLRELAGSVKKVLNSRSNLIGGAPLNSHMKTKADLRESSSSTTTAPASLLLPYLPASSALKWFMKTMVPLPPSKNLRPSTFF